MQIECPHCQTSYQLAAAAIGPEGRTVRCARCRTVWRVMPQPAEAFAGAEPDHDSPAAPSDDAWHDVETPGFDAMPEIDSPPTAAGDDHLDWSEAETVPQSRFGHGRLARAGAFLPGAMTARLGRIGSFAPAAMRRALRLGLTGVNVILAGLCIGIVVGRADIVRVMPQTAGFFEAIGFGVNLRGLVFADTAIFREDVGGARVMVIEGAVKSVISKPVELPRLHFGVHDASGQEIFSWTAVLEQPYLRAGDKALYKTRLAAPPEQARSVVVRFLNRNDILRAGGKAGESRS